MALAPLALLALVAQAVPPLPARSADPAGWWKSAVFYEVYVRSFFDHDGDGHGDLAGLSKKLEYFQTLGVDGLWLMPIYAGPREDGYAVQSFEAIEPRYGTMEDALALIGQAHGAALALLLDFTPNQVSDQHPWFVAAQAGDLGAREHFVVATERPPGSAPPRSPSEPGWTEAPALGGYYYHALSASLPDLNLRDKVTQRAVVRSFDGWLERGVDGLRLSGVRYLFEDGPGAEVDRPESMAFVHELAGHARAQQGAIVVSEAGSKAELAARYLEPGALALDFDRAQALDRALETGKPAALSAVMDKSDRLASTSFGFVSFGTNRDAPVKRAVAYGKDAQVLANAVVLLGGGVPVLWQGDELGLRAGNEEQARRPFRWDQSPGAGFSGGAPWRELGGREAGDDLESQRQDPGSIWSRTRALLSLRRQSAALSTGLRLPVKVEKNEHLMAFLREEGRDRALVVLNFSAAPQGGALDLRPLLGSVDERWAACLGGGRAAVLKGGRTTILAPGHGVLVFDGAERASGVAPCAGAPSSPASLKLALCAPGSPRKADQRCARALRYSARRGEGFSRDVEAELDCQRDKGGASRCGVRLSPPVGRAEGLRYWADLSPGPYLVELEVERMEPGTVVLAEGSPLGLDKKLLRGTVFVRDGRLGLEASAGALTVLGISLSPAKAKTAKLEVEVQQDRVVVVGTGAGVVEWRMNDSVAEPVEHAPLIKSGRGFAATLGPWPSGAVQKVAWVVRSEQGPFLTAEGGQEFVVKIGQ